MASAGSQFCPSGTPNFVETSSNLRRKDPNFVETSSKLRRKDPNSVETSSKLRRAGELKSQGLYSENIQMDVYLSHKEKPIIYNDN